MKLDEEDGVMPIWVQSASEVDSGFEVLVGAQADRPAEVDSAAAGLAKTGKDAAEGGVNDQALQLLLAQLRVATADVSGGNRLRAELVWGQCLRHSFMFTSPGGRAHLSRSQLRKLIRSKGLHLAETRAGSKRSETGCAPGGWQTAQLPRLCQPSFVEERLQRHRPLVAGLPRTDRRRDQ
jgi:hypothetical protein